MCADGLKERREMPLKSCLHCPFPFKCLLVWPGPGFRGSHGNLDSELFRRRFWNTDSGGRKDRHFCSCSFLRSWGYWDFDNSMSSRARRGPSGGEIGYRWGRKVEAFSADSERHVCSHWHAPLFPHQLSALTTSQRQCDERDVCASISTNIYMWSCCKLTCNQIIKYFLYIFWEYKMCYLLDLHDDTQVTFSNTLSMISSPQINILGPILTF